MSPLTVENYQVLIVDDDFAYAVMLRDYLKLTLSFKVDHAADIEAMWNHLATATYDILILDYELPDGNGLDILNELKENDLHIPVIMVTGRGDERVAARAIQLGAADYFIKGKDRFTSLPVLIHKVIDDHRMKHSYRLSQQKIRYQALLLNNVRDAIVVWDVNGKITYWNPAAATLFGWSSAERLGQPVAECYLETFEPVVRMPPVHSTSGLEAERSFCRRDGKFIWVSSRVTVLRDDEAGGKFIGWMDVSRDITERKQMEAQIWESRTRLAQANRLVAIGVLASGVAHLVYNPLTTIIADAQLLLQSRPDNPETRESARAIEEAGWQAQNVVQRLLNFAKHPGDIETLSINQTIENALDIVEAHIMTTGVKVEIGLAEELPPIDGCARQLEDLWVNLMLLARDRSSENGANRISICSRPGEKENCLIEITGRRHAISTEQYEDFFDPAFAGLSADHELGMELGICREIVRQHQGNFQVKNISDGRTMFQISLPGGQHGRSEHTGN